MYPNSIQKLVKLFSKFPAVGPKTAARFVFYLMRDSEEETEELLRSISDLKNKIRICHFCFNPFESSQVSSSPAKISEKFRRAGFGEGESEGNLCQICSNSARDRTLICIIEKETDLESIEKIKKYNGLYFILGGVISGLKKTDLKKLRIKELEERLKNPQKFGLSDAGFKEIILALNPTTEGAATALYLERFLKPFNTKITRLGRGLPVGGELEYADEETLSSAFESRR